MIPAASRYQEALAGHVRYKISETLDDKEAAEALRQAYIDDVRVYESYHKCMIKDPHTSCSNGEFLARRCKEIDEGLKMGRLHLGDKWTSDLPIVPQNCPNIQGVAQNEKLTVTQSQTRNTFALGYRIKLGQGQPDGGSILWHVLRPNSINIQPKLRGARPDWAQLCGAEDIKKYMQESGITKASLLSLCSNLLDPLLLAAPFIATARMLYRKVLGEVELPTWKSVVPAHYHG